MHGRHAFWVGLVVGVGVVYAYHMVVGPHLPGSTKG